MLPGEPYDANDPGLVWRRTRARRLTRRFNSTGETRATCRPPSWPSSWERWERASWSSRRPLRLRFPIRFGDHVAVKFNCVVLDCAAFRIGYHALFGPLVVIFTAEHPVDPVERLRGLNLAAPVTIGEDA